jgi:hypothetical protein
VMATPGTAGSHPGRYDQASGCGERPRMRRVGAARDAVHLRRQGLGLSHPTACSSANLPMDDFIALNPRDSPADVLAPKAAAKRAPEELLSPSPFPSR